MHVHPNKTTVALRTVAVFEAAKGIIVLLLGLGVLRLVHKDVDDGESSQAVESDATLFVTPTGFVSTSFGGETALSLTRQMSEAIQPPASLAADDERKRIRTVLGVEASRGPAPALVSLQLPPGVRDPGIGTRQCVHLPDARTWSARGA